jgi:hypothetical protein
MNNGRKRGATMADEAFLPARNLRYNVPAVQEQDETTSFIALAERYFRAHVAGQAEGTIDAKQRDLACFLQFYVQLFSLIRLWLITRRFE